MYCPNCGRKTTRRSKFCPDCGENLSNPLPKKAKKTESRGVPLHYVLAILAAGILLGVVIIKMFNGRNETTPEILADVPSIHSAAVLDIASEFNCPCGTCKDSLDECDCDHKNGAIEIKSFIAQQLLRHHKPHIVEMVQKQYGGLKSQSTLPPDVFGKPGESSTQKNQ
jgi:hypothetical protein